MAALPPRKASMPPPILAPPPLVARAPPPLKAVPLVSILIMKFYFSIVLPLFSSNYNQFLSIFITIHPLITIKHRTYRCVRQLKPHGETTTLTMCSTSIKQRMATLFATLLNGRVNLVRHRCEKVCFFKKKFCFHFIFLFYFLLCEKE